MSKLFETGSEKADKYVDAALKVAGVGVLAYMVGQYAENEEFEECAEICKAINALMVDCEPPIGGFVWGEPLKEWICNHVYSITKTDGSCMMNNMPEYADMVERMVYQ